MLLPVLLGIMLAAQATVLAATGAATVEVIPSALSLAPHQVAQFAVVLRNPTTQTLESIALEWVKVPGLFLKVITPNPEALAPENDFTWMITVSRTAELAVETTANLQVGYHAGKTARTAFTSLVITPRAAPAVENVASLQVETALESLLEQRSGQAFLIITNKSNLPLEVGEVQTSGPAFVGFKPLVQGITHLAPLDTLKIQVEISVTQSVQPGKHLLLFEVPIVQDQYGQKQTYRLVEKLPVTVGVLGESELLKLFEIPSLLLLPGILAVITAGMWWQGFKPADQKDKFPLKARNEAFWVVAVSVSILIGAIYPAFSELVLGQRRNYLFGYGLMDVIWIWVMGIGSGVLYSLGAAGVLVVVRRLKTARLERQEARLRTDYPTTQDDPLVVLGKLPKQNLRVGLERVRLTDGQELFLLQPRDDRRTEYWASSGIGIRLPDDIPANIEQQLTGQLVLAGDPTILLQKIQEGSVEVRPWSASPRKIPSSQIAQYLGQQVFVAQV